MAPKNAKKKTGRAVANVEKAKGGTNVVTGSLAKRLREDAEKFDKGFSSKDFVVPFLRIVEKTGGLMKKSSPDYDETAEEGMIYNSSTGRLYGAEEGIYLIPAFYTRRFTRWGLIDSKEGGGFKADYGTEYDLDRNCTKDDKGRFICKDNKNEHVVESADYFCILVDIETSKVEQVIVSMSSTRWKSAKRWNALIDNLAVKDEESGEMINNLPLFSGVYHLTTKPDNNDQGDWNIWSAEFHEFTLDMEDGERLYSLAKSFAENAMKGNVKMAAPVAEEAAEPEAPRSRSGKGKSF